MKLKTTKHSRYSGNQFDLCNTLAFKEGDISGPCLQYQKDARSHTGVAKAAQQAWHRNK